MKTWDNWKYALKGLKELGQNHLNFKIHLIFGSLAILMGFVLGISQLEWLALTLTIGLVLIAEGLNTAIECVVDLVSPDYHKLAGKAKDIGAASVLLAGCVAMINGLLIFGRALLPYFE